MRKMKKHLKNGAVFAALFVAVVGAYIVSHDLQPVPAVVAEKGDVEPEIVRGVSDKKQVIFTFDGGSGAESGEAILSTLKKHGVIGTFFLTGKFAEENTELVKEIAREGHEIFNHTYFHPDLTTMSEEGIKNELTRADEAIQNLTGKSTKPYFRPPYGARNERVRAVAAEAGYTSAYWTVDVLDWKENEGFTAEEAKKRILSNLAPGTIYLMHIGDTITGKILDEVFTEIESRGYAIVSLTQGI